jgi:hypothetical protein
LIEFPFPGSSYSHWHLLFILVNWMPPQFFHFAHIVGFCYCSLFQ